MSREDKKYYYYAKITVEAVSPLVLASGRSGKIVDVELVRDANGLPAIPGTTIAGILRHAIQKEIGEGDVKQLFGYQTRKEGLSSSIEVSWAYVHDSKNCIHKSFYPRTKIEEDQILKELYISESDNPIFKRDHVNLTEKGVANAKDGGKFDRYFVPSGCRFTFSIGLWSENDKDDNWSKILNILFSPSFRIGAAGRAGYGKIKIVEIKTAPNDCFDISKPEDVESFRICTKKYDLSKSNDETENLEKIELKLRFPLGFRIGGGTKSFLDLPIDMLPYSEKVIVWNENGATFESEPKITIPGSAIKGALRHRTAYHLARINKNWASSGISTFDDGLSELFGYASKNNDSESEGMAGKIWFTDLYLDCNETYELSRNGIDRFTGGTLPGTLFQEENVRSEQTFKTCIYLDKSIDANSDEYKAFKWALDDLTAGRLALGGGSGHGLGFNYTEVAK